MASKTIEALKQMADEDLVIDKSQLDNESIRTPKIHNKWLKMYIEAKDELIILEQRKRDLQRENWLYYTGKGSDSQYAERGVFGHKILKNDLSLFLESDPKLNEIDLKIHAVKSKLEFIQKTLEECNRRSYLISNALRAIGFMNGINY